MSVSSPPLRPWSRVAFAVLLFLPTPVVAAFPNLAGFFAHEWAGVPAVMWAIPAYLVLFMLLSAAYAGFSARMGG
jgi:hypothetical protein